jgi:hypothetical protein
VAWTIFYNLRFTIVIITNLNLTYIIRFYL